MLFNSYEFVFLFLPITWIIFYFVAEKFGQRTAALCLVVAAFFFYAWWDINYVPLLFLSICFNFGIGKMLSAGERRRKCVLIFGIALNIFLLGYFKYAAFFCQTINAVTDSTILPVPEIILPLGISFFTFTQIAYLVDVWRRETRNDSFLTYCEFVTIFPHLIAGPIINHKEMLPQFKEKENYRINWSNTALGLAIFVVGLAKKILIADKLAVWANDAFAHCGELTCLEGWLGALAYTLQLYFDFSGYSEMAIGLGLMFNLRLPVNFDSPYQSKSIIEFWRRWHMTLGLWVKNYLYIPMGGNRYGEWRKMFNLFFAMLIIGLWHGAGWTFVAWGAWHGALLVINHTWRRAKIELPGFLSQILTFGAVVVGWIFFRAENFSDGFKILFTMTDFSNLTLPVGNFEKHLVFLSNLGVGFSHWIISSQAIGWTIALLLVAFFAPNPLHFMRRFKVNWATFAVISALAVYSVYKMNSYTEFLYFQF